MRVGVMMMLSVAGPALAAAPMLDRIDVVGDEAAAVRLHLSAPVSATAHRLPAEGGAPARVYIDLSGAALGAALPHVLAGAAPVVRVRASQFDPTTVRIVVDLERRVPFVLRQMDETITLELEAPAPTAAAIEPPAPTPTAAAPEPPAPAPMAAAIEPPTPAPTDAAPEPPAPSAPPAPGAPSRSPQPSTPRVKPRTATAARPLVSHPPLIVLDAGHGGRDPGAEGIGGVLEKDIVLEVTQMVAGRLAARLPVEVLLTRTDDSFVPIERRVAMPGDGATLFISLHANACSDSSAQGLEVFYGGGGVRTASTPGGSWRAALLGRCLDHALQSRVGGVRGEARPGPFGVLVRNPAPSALIEIGYLTHPGEAARAQDRRYHELLADAVVDGVAAFLRASAPPL